MSKAENGSSSHPQTGVIGFPTALATAVGLIMATPVILTVTTGFGMGGGTFAAAIVIAFLIMQAQAMSFAEMSSILPTTGSVYDYITCGLGRFCGITGTIAAYILVHVFAGTTVVALAGPMALVNFDSINAVFESSGTGWMVGVGLVVLFGIVNAFGIEAFSRIEIGLTIVVWFTLMAFGIAGVVRPPAMELEGFFGASSIGTDLPAVLSLVGMAMFMFVGFEFVTPLAAELRKPERQIPRAMTLGLCAVATCMILYGAAVARNVANVPLDEAGTVHLLDTPLAVPRFAEEVMGSFGKIWIGIAFLFAGAATINTLMAGLPRIMYGMALDGSLPRIFAYLHPRWKTPLVGIAAAAFIPCFHAWLIQGDIDQLGNLILAAVCSWGVAYIMISLSVISLRIRRPDLKRPYRTPFYPAPQVVSIIGIAVAIWYITPGGADNWAVYYPFGVMILITAAYALAWLLIRRVPLFKPVAVETILEEEQSAGTIGDSAAAAESRA